MTKYWIKKKKNDTKQTALHEKSCITDFVRRVFESNKKSETENATTLKFR